MATRRGRFGRIRQVPSLTSQFVAIAREMQNLRDQNMKSAWENGGLFEGKKVTDDMLLEHFRERRGKVDPNDPLWDYYNNLVQNYEFAIAESKMTLKYAEKKVGEAAMAKFYRHWAGKLPQDSEAYRALMRSAAQYLDIAKSRGRAGAASARASAYANSMQSNYDKNEKGYDTSTMFLAAAMVLDQGGLTEGEYEQIVQAVQGRGGKNLAEVLSATEMDHAKVERALDRLNNDPAFADLKAQMDAAMKGVPGYNGTLTYDQWIAFGESKSNGLDNRVGISKTFGDKSGAESARVAGQGFDRWLLANKDIDVVKEYSDAKRKFATALADPTLTAGEVVALGDQFRATLTTLMGSAESDWVKGSLEAEISALDGKWDGALSISESPAGATTAEANPQAVDDSAGDLASTAYTMQRARQDVELLSNGGVYAPIPGAKPGGPQWMVIPNPGPVDPNKGFTVFVTEGGRTVPYVVPIGDITAQGGQGVDPNTGRPTAGANLIPGADSLLGKVATLPDGRTVYGIYVNGGDLMWYSEPPWTTAQTSDGRPSVSAVADGKGGMTVTILTDGGTSMVDPRSALAPSVTDEKLMNSARFGDPWVAAALGDFPMPGTDDTTGKVGGTSGRWDLVNANAADIKTYYDTTFGSAQMPTGATNPDGSPVLGKAADVLFAQFKDAQVTAAALIRDPRLLQQNAASSVGERFWLDYERAYSHGRPQEQNHTLWGLLGDTPAAQKYLAEQRQIASQKNTYGKMEGYAAAAAASPSGVAEVISEAAARQRALDLIRSMPRTTRMDAIKYQQALSAVNDSPALKLPDVVSQFTGQKPSWFIDQTPPAPTFNLGNGAQITVIPGMKMGPNGWELPGLTPPKSPAPTPEMVPHGAPPTTAALKVPTAPTLNTTTLDFGRYAGKQVPLP